MAKAKKLPSGNWRVRIYSHTDSLGKKHYESFTASTKQQAEMMGAKFANDLERQRSNDLTISEAVSAYIKSNDGILSPSTINGYVKDSKKIAQIGNVRVRKVTTQILQQFITDLAKEGLSSKTIRNTWGLLRSSLSFVGCDKIFKVHLPPKEKQVRKSPENEEIVTLYNNASPTLKKAILLGCLSLRRGEISAIKYGDIKGNRLYIHADLVWGADKKWHYKPTPKTDASNRIVYLPKMLVEMLGDGAEDDYIIPVKPNAIGNAFLRLKKKLDIDIRFHDLRHYFASLAKVLNIPDRYAENLGGWEKGSKTLREIYQNEFDGLNEQYANMINEHLENMTQNMTQK